jgi:nucleotidyltransferase/DNA polymerase involved in DNA repair
MSVVCWHIPNLLVGLAVRDQPALTGRPLALLDASEAVCALSGEARASRVAVGMSKHQAERRCPDLVTRPLDMPGRQQEQSALMGALAEWGLPVEERGWGSAYIDLRAVATDWHDIRPLCIDLAQKIHQRWDKAAPLVPKIGWDTGKFVAYAAAASIPQGKMRPVPHAEEQPFLRQQPAHLLPLASESLRQLSWLAIRTVGAYAALPEASVRQRFGEAGKVAHRLAQGKDNRPVQPNVLGPPEAVEVDFESPVEGCDIAGEHILRTLRPRFRELAEGAKGCRHLRLTLRFLGGSTRTADCTFIEAVNPISFPEHAFRLRESVMRQISSVAWPSALIAVQVTLLAVAELMPEQLSLFPEQMLDLDGEDAPDASIMAATAERLAFARLFIGRYGPRAFLQIESVDDMHPVVERRARLSACTTSY